MKIVNIRMMVLCSSWCLGLGAIGAGCVDGRGLDEEASPSSANSTTSVERAITEALDGDAARPARPRPDDAGPLGPVNECPNPNHCTEPFAASTEVVDSGPSEDSDTDDAERPGPANECPNPNHCTEP